ncbi:MAG: amino acid adenylation domain-containing protein [Bacteroidales bacterium]|nr:amino acid adenylation domain-containing protein [Bacteroidales bacterium]
MERLNSSKYSIDKIERTKERVFWQNKFGTDFKKTIISYDKLDSNSGEIEKSFSFCLPDDISKMVRSLSKDSEPRIFVVLTSCLAVLLSELNQNREQIVLGMPIYSDDEDINPINSLIPLIINLDDTESFKKLLNSVKNSITEGIEHYAYPITAMPELLELDYEKNSSFPIFDIAVCFDGIQDKQHLETIKHNVLFRFGRTLDNIEVTIEYNSSLYEENSIEKLQEPFLMIMRELLSDLNRAIANINIVPTEQNEKILNHFNNTKTSFNENTSIPELFINQVNNSPDRVALVINETNITYKVLNERSDLLAQLLRSKGVKNDSLIGLMCDRSIDLFIGILGILKAGCGYLAIDVNLPQNRVMYMIKDSGVNLLLGHSEYIQKIENIEKLDIVEIENELNEYSHKNYSLNHSKLAYVLYTSGTTGFPKGVVTEQKNIIAYCNAFLNEFSFQSNDIILQQASYSFDTFVEEVFPILFSGGKIVIASNELVGDVPKLANYILKNTISIIDSSPLLLNELGKNLLSKNNIRIIISGGDILKGEYLDTFSKEILCYNTYGPTETTVCATFFKYTQKQNGDVPIGKPISNYTVLILNKNQKIVPNGIIGEICIGGEGISRGYLNQVELTNEKFILNPYNNKEKLYKSGDLGKYDNNGIVRFCGRIDNQVNIRGFRIELGEIENQILKHPKISNSVVIPIEKDDEKWICAYVVAESLISEKQIREFLINKLPEYMIPYFIKIIDELPMNSNGKVSIKSLPNPFESFSEAISFIDNITLAAAKDNIHKQIKVAKKSNNNIYTQSAEVSKDERNKLLFEFNNTNHEFDSQKHIIELFEEQVVKTPDRVAIVFNDQNLTYIQLDKFASCLAIKLIESGVQSNSIVGLLAQRSLNMIISILAIFKSGGAFMPLEEDAPDERLQHIISNTSPKIILIDETNSIKNLDARMINISRFDFSCYSDQKIYVKKYPNDITHVLHTSGSTGRPKGVLIENHSIVNLINYVGDLLKLDETINVLSLTPVTFDVFSAETLLPLIKGAKVNIIDSEKSLDIKQILKLIRKEQILFLQCSPTFLQKIIADNELNKCIKNVKYIISAGEPLLDSIKENFTRLTNTQLYNLYGPTETTLYSTGKNVTGKNTLNIGQPIYNTQIRILDSLGNLVQIGNEGELLIGGEGVARGYINQPEKTHELFEVKDDKMFYKTGDLAKWSSSGDIDFLGRIDNQIQLGGIRVEPDEIENSIITHPNINEAAVIVKEDEEGNKYLLACLLADKRINETEIREFLIESLPIYLIPRKFVQLERMPYNSSRKIHRNLLESLNILQEVDDNFKAPETEIERKLVEIWSEVINIPREKISVMANFFAIGGHSLKASVLTRRIHKEIGVEFPIRDVFLHSTIQAQAGQIEISTKKDFVCISKAKVQEYYSLSSGQKRLYLLQEMKPDSTVNNMPYIIPLVAEAEKEKIEEVFRLLINRHESFRTSFEIKGEKPVQYIHEQVEFNLEELTVTKEEIQEKRQQFIQAFDLRKAPLLRVSKVDVKGEGSLLMIDMHHIISDGVSHSILEQEFQRLYSGEDLPPLSLQYKDYSEWQNSEEQQIKLKNQEEYWIRKFEEEIPVLNLPADYVRPVIQSHEGASVSFALSKEETQHIKTLAKENDITLYMSVLSMYTILLSKLSGQEDIIVGTPIASRNHSDLENIVGMFVNTLAIRNEVNGNKTLKEFLRKLKQTTLEAYENQDYQFEDLVENVSVERDISRNPLFDVMFNLLNHADYSGDLTDFGKGQYVHTPSISKFDLGLSGVDYGDQLLLSFVYCKHLFKPESIERYIGYFKQIINQLSGNIDSELSSLEILSSEEKQQLLYEFNDTKVDYPTDKTIHQLFEEQVERSIDCIALVFNNQVITYKELNLRSNQLAQLLLSKGLKSEDIVGILLDRSIEMIISILGVLKAGGTYLPLDIESPKERINYIIKESKPNLILSQSSVNKNVELEVEFLDLFDPSLYLHNKGQNISEGKPSDSAYIIYTSGSTGKPKGVIIEHGNVVNLVNGLTTSIYNNYQETLHISLISPIYFDASVKQIFPSLTLGHSLHIIPEPIRFEGSALVNHYTKHDIQIADGTPFHAQMLAQYIEYKTQALNIRQFVIGGDELKLELMQSLFQKIDVKNLKISNVYGPTECTDVTTIKTSTIESLKDKGNTSIGKPISNYEIYILGKNLELLPTGVSGELCISGAGVSRGYLFNEELSSEKFIEHPYKEGERLYKTGDLARWLPDGDIEFLGRIDHQVKIRGFRIELGEIENVLLKHESIKESVVLAIQENGDKYLCAYLVTNENFNQEDIRSYLSSSLPDYMIPSYFVELDKIPLTSNGKVNRKVLPLPEVKAGDDYVAPLNETEEKIAQIWSEVLNIEKEKISVMANFFNIGGHSLKAMVIANRIQKKFSVKIPLTQFFKSPFIRSLALFITINIKQEKEHVEYTEMEF